MTIDEMIAVLQAAKAGKQIQREYGSNSAQWYDININEWLRMITTVRVKPEPREWDIAVHKANNRTYPPDWIMHDSRNSWEIVRVQEVPK
jgi:hypothetical protein